MVAWQEKRIESVRICLGPDDKIWALIGWRDGVGSGEAKPVQGGYWSKQHSVWKYPKTMATCRAFRAIFGSRLVVSKGLADWARAEVDKEEGLTRLRTANDARLDVVPQLAPALHKAMSSRTYQRVGSRFIADARSVIVADEPGVGKTLESLGGILEGLPTDQAQNILVFAKKTAITSVWAREIRRWLGPEPEIYALFGGTLEDRGRIMERFEMQCDLDLFQGLRFVIANPEMVRTTKIRICPVNCDDDKFCPEKPRHKVRYEPEFPQFFDRNWDAIIVDECHKSLIGKSSRAKTVTKTRLGMTRLKVREGGLRVALSGTPYRGKLEYFWGILNWLDSKKFGSYWRWVETYFEVDKSGYAWTVGELRSTMAAQFDIDHAPYMLRRTKSEVLPELPPKQYNGSTLDPDNPDSMIGVWLEMTPRQQRMYDRLKRDTYVKLSGGTLETKGALSELTRLKQFATMCWGYNDVDILEPIAKHSNKFDWLLEFLEEKEGNPGKVVVCSQFTVILEAFAEALTKHRFPNYLLTGKTSQRRRLAVQERFQDPDDPVQVCLINVFAGGESINLDQADDLVFLDETFIPEDQLQAEDRCHRASRIHQVTIHYLRSLGTVEEWICELTDFREAIGRARLDGSRGIDTRKLVANFRELEDERKWA